MGLELKIQAATTLLIGLVVIAVLLWFFWPGKGGMAMIRELRISNERVILEDALKFIFDCEYKKVECNIASLAGNLNISMDKAGKLLERLTVLELVTVGDNAVLLTDAGRSYALRIVRIHRVWERYLADHTSVEPAEWHKEACRVEHTISDEQIEELAARIGNPVFDPHGDPIPTAEGEIIHHKGVALSSLKEGDMARIIHLEDEPRSIYEQLLVLGLYPGMEVYVTDVNDKKITFVAEGEECVLTPLFAGYITVEAVEAVYQSKHELLSGLNIGEKAEVLAISPNCRGQQRRRLMDLGVVPGSKVEAVMKSASGDPVGYRILGTTIGIRKQHADQVFIHRLTEGI